MPIELMKVTGLRMLQCVLVLLMTLFALLVGLNNVLDYNSNFQFVQHVLSMDTTFADNRLMGRAIQQSWFHHLAYTVIIASELGTGVLCGLGTLTMWRRRKSPAVLYFEGKMLVSWGLALGITLWFGGFMIIGAEWFLMWQSDIWNGQDAAFRFIVCLFATLIFLHLPEPAATD